MGESVAARSHRAANRGERPAENLQPVAQVIQRDHMSQLGIEHGHNMAPAGKGARLLSYSGLPGKTTHQESRNQVANLAQDIKPVGALVWSCLFFHLLLVEQLRTHSNAFLAFSVRRY